MPAFYRGFRRGYRRGYRRNYRRSRWPYRSMRSGLVRAQTSGTRRMNLSVPIQEAFSIAISTPAGGAGNFWSDVYCVQPYFAVTGGVNMVNVAHGTLMGSRLYRVYTTLYDEVKINSCYVKMTVMTNIGSGGVTPALRVLTMWDRNLNAEDIAAANLPGHDDMETGSGSQTTMIVNNSRAILSRYVKASDIQEWTKFHDCSIVSSGNYRYDGCWCTRQLATENIRNGQDCGFVPGMYFCLNSATAPAAGASFNFAIQLDIKYNVTFRNPKFGLSVSNAKGIGLDRDVETKDEMKVESDEKEMDDDEKEEDVRMDMTDEEIAALLEKFKKQRVSEDTEKKDGS